MSRLLFNLVLLYQNFRFLDAFHVCCFYLLNVLYAAVMLCKPFHIFVFDTLFCYNDTKFFFVISLTVCNLADLDCPYKHDSLPISLLTWRSFSCSISTSVISSLLSSSSFTALFILSSSDPSVFLITAHDVYGSAFIEPALL